MAGDTFLGCACKDAVDMTCGTGGIDVRSGQREGRQVVIEGGRLPTRGGVTGRAVRPELTAVMVVGRVAGITGCGRAFELHVLMTTGAGNGRVLAGQLEDGAVMVKRAGFPGSSCMARLACTKRTAVRVSAGMARGAGSRCADKEFILMALRTGYGSVLARQLEDRIVVIERGGRPTTGGVTFRTLCAELAGMWISITMTRGAIHGGAFEDTIDMAACTGNSCMFTSQFEGRIVVIECGWLPTAW